MNQLQLYINNELVDLADDSPIALTFQINNLAEVKNQQGNTSNQFKLPLTQRNRQILGYPDDIAFTNCKPYNNYDARVVQDGLEIIPYGTAVLNSIEQSSANITILSGNVDFFDAISGKIYEMGDERTSYGINKPFEKYQHTWNVQNVVRSQQHGTANGWIWPVIDYGNLVYNPTVKEHEINVRNLRPGFFIKTVIDEIIASTGYRATGSLLQNQLYPKLIAQFSNSGFEHGTDRQNKPDPTGVSVSIGADFSVTHILATGNIGTVPFTTTHFDDGHQFTGTNLFTSKSINSVDVKLTIPYLRFEGRPNNEKSSYLMLHIMRENAASEVLAEHTFDLTSFTRVPGTSGNGLKGYIEARNTVITAQADIAINDRIFVRYEFFKDRPSNFTIAKGTMLEITPTSKQVLYGQDVQCERILPDISQKDLLKDIFQRFGIICQTNNTARVINFASFKDIKDNIPMAKDWTDKCLDQGKGISFQLGNYAQVNYLKYKEDDAVLPKGLADSQIKVDDKTLPATADLFESQFAPSLDRPYIGGSITQIKMTEPDADNVDFNTSVSPRILIDRKIDLRNYNNQKITFTDGNPANNKVVNDIISAPYFYRADENDSLRWEDLRLKYYPELEKILQQTKKVERYFLLTPRDILELDLLIPVYLEQDSTYYYINKIDSWRKGQPVKVELIKLG